MRRRRLVVCALLVAFAAWWSGVIVVTIDPTATISPAQAQACPQGTVMAAGANGASACGLGTPVQRINATLDALGNASVAFGTAFTSSSPIVNPVPMNTGAQPIICNPSARSSTAATVHCWVAAIVTVSILGFNVNVFSGTLGAGTAVMTIAGEPTQ